MEPAGTHVSHYSIQVYKVAELIWTGLQSHLGSEFVPLLHIQLVLLYDIIRHIQLVLMYANIPHIQLVLMYAITVKVWQGIESSEHHMILN